MAVALTTSQKLPILKRRKFRMKLLSLTVALLLTTIVFGQIEKPVTVPATDSTSVQQAALIKDSLSTAAIKDTTKAIPHHRPKTATLRSLVLPGWGQVYNRQYWKLPIIYAALGITAGIYIYNNTWYKRTRDAYEIKVDNDTQHFSQIHPRLQPLSASSLQSYRNIFRQDRDYSMLWFIVFWGLNIVDATVYAHLKEFDVSPDLSLKVKPMLRQNGNAGFSLVLGYKSPPKNSFNYLKF